MKQYISNPPVKYKNFKPEPAQNIQFCKTENGKNDTGLLNEFGASIYEDQKDSNLKYNFLFYSSFGEPYYVLGAYSNSNSKMLKIQFFNTHSIAILPYGKWKTTDSYIDLTDPYSLTMFNNQCCLGNIDYKKLGKENPYLDMQNGMRLYEAWCDIMSRCFDPTHCLFGLYGGAGCLPLNPYWRCFRYFYKYIDTAAHYHLFDPDPNDKTMYTKPVTFYNILQPSTMKPSLYKVLRKDV